MEKNEEVKPKVLVVDDSRVNQELIKGILIPLGYEISQAWDGVEALEKVKEFSPDMILLDVMMPRMNGFEVARQLKGDEETKIIPIVMVTALQEVEDRVKAMEAGADDFLTKPVDTTELRTRIQSLLKVKAYNDHMRNYQNELETEVAKRTEELKNAFDDIKELSLDTTYRLTRAAEYKDEDTATHIMRMSHYAVAVSRKMGLDAKTVEGILYASPMHDVGKIGIPDSILLKPDKLDPEEWEIIRQHTYIGKKILENSRSKYINLAEEIAFSHHERWDGSGYPQGLKESEIPLSGRITAIADVFDALTSKRPYKEIFTVEESFGIIEEERRSHFDPDVVDAFFAARDEMLSIKEKYKDEGKSLLIQFSGSEMSNKKVTGELSR
ncbi:MAG: response regulator [Candidatus Latescibacteria bacterium]|jgi:putative two-component system response regulator|nr:response regulator [Candidatus Latescibacterota bacterium]